MEESTEEASRRNELLKMYKSTKEALRIIGDVARDGIAANPSAITPET